MPLSDLTDDEFIERFKTTAISPKDWDHLGHVRAGCILVMRMTPAEALPIMRRGLETLLKRARAEGFDPRVGYHETVTLAWLKIIRAALDADDSAPQDARAFCTSHPELNDPRLQLRYYSRKLLATEEARSTFVEPDLEPLP